jgi:RsiW-degrading membrane proteinase PrsW (M82 family)
VFRLRILDGARAGDVHDLVPGDAPVVLGRGHGATVLFAQDATMSRAHAELVWNPIETVWLLKNRSQHGTFLGATVVKDEMRRLVPGDELRLGETRVCFERVPEGPALEIPGLGIPGLSVRKVEPPPGAADKVARDAPTANGVPVELPPPAMPPAAPGAVAPESAGYDEDGVFHMGFTMLGQPAVSKSFLYFGTPSAGKAAVAIKKRTLIFFFVLLAFSTVGCCCGSLDLFLPMLAKIPGPFLIASSVALLPTVPYLALFKFLDRNGQIPLKNYLACFVWGASVGCGFSAVMNGLAQEFFSNLAGQATVDLMTATFVAPFVEESTKGLAVLVVFLILQDEFDNAVAGMILGAAAGLGFALVENCVYDSLFLVQGKDLGEFFYNGTFRALTCALVGHPVYTSMTGLGFGLAREWGKKSAARFLVPPLGWALAVAMHALWNGSAGVLIPLVFQDNVIAGRIALGVFVGGGSLVFFLSALTYSLWKERRVLLDHLSDEVAKGFIEPEELDNFRSLFGRERFVLGGFSKGTYKLRKELRRAQLDLAFRKWHLEQGDAVKGRDVDRALLDARTRIRDARNAINAREGLHGRGPKSQM